MSSQILKAKYATEKKFDCFYTQRQIQVTSSGKYILCQCSNFVTVVEVDSGSVVKKIETEEEEVTALSLSPNDSSLALGFNSSSVKHYKFIDTPEVDVRLLTSFKSYHRGPVLTMCWDSSSVLLATGSSDGTVRVWDLNQKYCTHSLKEACGVIRVLMFDKSLRERPWVFGAADGDIFIWLLQAGSSKVVAKLIGHDSPVTGLQLSHSGQQLFSSGLDKVIIVWDLSTHASKKIIPVFESLSGILLKPQTMEFYGVPKEATDENFVFTIGNKGTPRIWNVDSGKEVWKSSEPIVPRTEEEILLFNQLILVETLDSFVLTTHDNNIIFKHCHSMNTWKQLVGYNEEILDAIFLGENLTHTAVASNNSQIRIYENASNSCHLLPGHTATVLALSNHPVDKTIFASSSHDNTARIWKFSEDGCGRCLAVASGHTHSVGSLTLASDFLITGSKDTCIKSWTFNMKNLLSNEETTFATKTQRAHEKDINNVALSKNFHFVGTASQDRTAKIWDAKTLELLGSLQGHKKGIWCIQFSPTDCLVATASADGTIKLWTLNGYTNVATFEGHEASVLRVAWVSQGLQLVSAGADGLLKLWTLKNNVCVGTFDEHEGRVWAMAVAEDGRRMLTGGADSTLVWWRDVTQEEKEKELKEANRLVEEEQILLNLVQKKRWSKALRLTLRLNQPFRGLTILKSLLDESPDELKPVLRRLRKEELATLIEFAVQWNTKTKNVREAQSVINYVLKENLPEHIEKLPNWQTTLEGLLPYTERHLKRVSALQQSTSIINYMIATMTMGVDEDIKAMFNMHEDQETSLLQLIPKDTTGKDEPVSNDDEIMGASEDDDDDEDDDEESGVSTDEGSDEAVMEVEEPIVSVDDIRSNFTYEKIVAESDEEEESESGISS